MKRNFNPNAVPVGSSAFKQPVKGAGYTGRVAFGSHLTSKLIERLPENGDYSGEAPLKLSQ